jgi:hypothetical protein
MSIFPQQNRTERLFPIHGNRYAVRQSESFEMSSEQEA